MSGTLVPMGTGVPVGTHQNLKILGTAVYRVPARQNILGTDGYRLPVRKNFLGTYGYWVPAKFSTRSAATLVFDPHRGGVIFKKFLILALQFS